MNNNELIQYMLQTGFLKSERYADAFASIDRKDFVGPKNLAAAHDDRPLKISHGQTISQPSTVAFMLEKLEPKLDDYVLDLGSGSGWTTALLTHIVGRYGRVLGIEIVPELVTLGQKNLSRYQFSNVLIRKASTAVGAPQAGPFDRILVSAEAEDVPTPLLDQLKAGGTLVIPIRDSVEVVKKNIDGSLSRENYRGFRFVPLI